MVLEQQKKERMLGRLQGALIGSAPSIVFMLMAMMPGSDSSSRLVGENFEIRIPKTGVVQTVKGHWSEKNYHTITYDFNQLTVDSAGVVYSFEERSSAEIRDMAAVGRVVAPSDSQFQKFQDYGLPVDTASAAPEIQP